MSNRKVEAAVAQLAEPLAEQRGLVLLDVEYRREGGRWFLQCVVDREGGVTMDECAAFSEALDPVLEGVEGLAEDVVVEVMSPGLDRTLRNDREFAWFRGREVEVTTYRPVDGRRRFQGRLEGLEDGHVVVTDQEGIHRIPRDAVAKTQLQVRI
ncbi:ribosome maturation factor RimP [Thermaerobacter sp. PB12/4term]|uniref:ribosome maturation factor RimP n=1 Tax=Thermaerobacter sp. PB12/4term TaxID=2293838 RepID=UPI000E325E04|nr:ribosome maturation factor RimP [Thermaerobacter sp. PB12/4term]QIA26966.1 ribosome maturation factor RimP [Thermaerobacter sp. PB12/4term]